MVRKWSWIQRSLSRECLLYDTIERKIGGGLKGMRWRRIHLIEKRKYLELKKKILDNFKIISNHISANGQSTHNKSTHTHIYAPKTKKYQEWIFGDHITCSSLNDPKPNCIITVHNKVKNTKPGEPNKLSFGKIFNVIIKLFNLTYKDWYNISNFPIFKLM